MYVITGYTFFFLIHPRCRSPHAGSSQAPGRRFPRRRNRCEQHKADGEADIGTAQIETVAGIYINMEQTMSSDQRKS